VKKRLFIFQFIIVTAYVFGQSPVWQYLGPKTNHYQYKGLFQSVWADKTNLNLVLAGSHTGGLFLTENALSEIPQWRNITDNLPGMNYGVSGIVVQPGTNNQTIYISTYTGGGLLTSGFGIGLMVTYNGGNSWQRVGPDENYAGKKTGRFPLQSMACNTQNVNEMATWFQKDLYLTNNAWKSFRKVSLPFHADADKTEIADVEYAPFEPGKMYIATRTNNQDRSQLFLSEDYGNTWKDITPKDVIYQRIEVATINNPEFKGKYYIAYGNTDVHIKYFNGKTFSEILNSYFVKHLAAKTYWYLNFDVNEVDTSVMYISMTETSRSVDGGKTFKKIGTYNGPNTHADVRATFLAVSTPEGKNDKIFLANDGGISLSHDFNATDNVFFRNLNGNGLYANQFWGIEVLQSEKLFVSGGTQDNGAFFIKDNFESNNVHSCGDAYSGLPLNDSLAISLCFPPLTLLHNTNKNSNVRITINDPYCDARRPLFSKDSFVYIAYHDIWRAKIKDIERNKLEFENISQIPTFTVEGNNIPNKACKSFAISPFNSALLVYQSPNWERTQNNGKLYYCDNLFAKKKSFQDITSINNTSRAEINRWYQMESITADATNKHTFYYIAKDEFDATNCEIIKFTYLPDSNKAIVKEIKYNLSKNGYNKLLIDPLTNVLYLAANDGLYTLNITAGDTVWKNHHFFPRVQVSDLAFNFLTNTLYVATYGRGIYFAGIPNYGTIHKRFKRSNSLNTINKVDGIWELAARRQLKVSGKVIICSSGKIVLGRNSKLIIDKGTQWVNEFNQPINPEQFIEKRKKAHVVFTP